MIEEQREPYQEALLNLKNMVFDYQEYKTKIPLFEPEDIGDEIIEYTLSFRTIRNPEGKRIVQYQGIELKPTGIV